MVQRHDISRQVTTNETSGCKNLVYYANDVEIQHPSSENPMKDLKHKN